MISYLILALTVSLAICSPLVHDQSVVDDSRVNLQERFFTGKSQELLKKLAQILIKACDQGIETFVKVINDPDVQGILNHMDSLTRKTAEILIQTFKNIVERIDEATKEKPSVQERDLKESSTVLLDRLAEILGESYTKGSEYFYKVLDGPDVQGILEHLGSVERNAVNTIIADFKSLVDKATKEDSTKDKRGLKESSTATLGRLIQILLKAYRQGSDYFYKVLNDPDVQGILDHLGPLSRKAADSIIQNFKELVDKIDEATKPDVQKRDIQESSEVLIKRLVQTLLTASKKGSEYFNQVLNDPDVQEILNHLGPLSRKIALGIIDNFKKLVNKIDEATKTPSDVEKRDFKESSYSLLKKLIRILTIAYEKGSKAFYEALEDPDVKAILGSLNSLTRKTADVLIEQFKKLVISVDNATNNIPSISERDLKETVTSNMKKLIQILLQASYKGSEYFSKVLNDPEVVAIRQSLGRLNAKIIDSIILKFMELFDKIDNATKDPKEEHTRALSDWKEDSKTQIKNLCQILIKASRKGGEYFNKVVNDPDVQNILEHLGPLSRKVANSIIQTFKELVEKLDNATKDNTI